jgi:hypothetical protein
MTKPPQNLPNKKMQLMYTEITYERKGWMSHDALQHALKYCEWHTK